MHLHKAVTSLINLFIVVQVELFLNSVPILKNLSSEERTRVAGALEELVFDKGARVIQQVCLCSAIP
jgi:hypothetical protein